MKHDPVVVVLPEYSMDKVSEDLRYLTEILLHQGYETSGGLLGGEYGYGAYFENDIFMMHPYCWCEQDDCEWCRGCSCPDEAYQYIVDGIASDFDGYVNAYFKGLPRDVVKHEELFCDYCKGLVGNAPNFLHKPSQTTVRWYKYIGRDMEVNIIGDWGTIFNECVKSIQERSDSNENS